MSDLIIKKEIRKILRNSGMEVTNKMVCPIVKLFRMKHRSIDSKNLALIATKLINEY